MRSQIIKEHTITFLLASGMLLCALCSCASMPTVKEIARNRDFQANTFSLQMLIEKYGRQTTETVVLFSVEHGFDATVRDSLRSRSDIEGAVRYMDIMAMQYQSDQRARCFLNISILYYLLGDRDGLDKYYKLANGLDFSDDTKRTFKRMMVIYPNY
ncbi:MAG: hypothetical protein IKQ61_11080 [Spirochaetales bacterium]|nr:hypothetical protein [Spirochaetales bacterium]MBR6200788.1 hypothetical protein [Spirochaetales bacterium]